MENFIIYFPVLMAVLLAIVLITRHISNSLANSKVEAELESDKKSADKLAVAISKQSAGFEDCREKTERIEQNQSGVTERIINAANSINEARERSENTVELIDECLEILSEAEKTSKQS